MKLACNQKEHEVWLKDIDRRSNLYMAHDSYGIRTMLERVNTSQRMSKTEIDHLAKSGRSVAIIIPDIYMMSVLSNSQGKVQHCKKTHSIKNTISCPTETAHCPQSPTRNTNIDIPDLKPQNGNPPVARNDVDIIGLQTNQTSRNICRAKTPSMSPIILNNNEAIVYCICKQPAAEYQGEEMVAYDECDN